MERLNRRDLFKAALGAVGAMVVGKADAKTEVTQVERPIWEYGLLPVKHRYSLDWMDDQLSTPGPQPIRADDVWAYTDETMPNTFGWTKHTAGPYGEIISNDRTFREHFRSVDAMFNDLPPEALRVGNDVRALAEDYTDGWEEGEGFDG